MVIALCLLLGLAPSWAAKPSSEDDPAADTSAETSAASSGAPPAKAPAPTKDPAPKSKASIPADDDDGGSDVVVYGEHLVAQARKKLVNDLQDHGFDQVIRKENATIYRHSATWKGEVVVYDDGWIYMKRQPVQFRPPSNLPLIPKGSPVAWATCLVLPLCVHLGGQTVSQPKMMAQRRRTLHDVEPKARVYGERVADLHVDKTLVELPDRLTALWEDGTPLFVPGDTAAPELKTPDLRRRALLDYWESRTDTVWGARVRAAIEAFIREEVQYSPFPFTDAEVAEFNRRRTCSPELDLNRDWEQVLADLQSRAGQ